MNLFTRKSIKFYIVFLSCLLLKIFFSYLFSYISILFSIDAKNSNPFENEDKKFIFLTVVFIVPFLETLVFQYVPYHALRLIKVHNSLFRLLIPTLIFGLSHYYSWMYIVVMCFMGSILNYFYLYCVDNRKSAFMWVAILHSVYNLYQLIFMQ
ncbi:CPBP family intramembrane glutamic endopeptidase [Pedobacter miscanthi]|uniref:CAAX prenyl protease 2/Lysostaphin resistance protein A-like domain-containing protein n=1 Tax=Pedobacter miscanthi TaxID=2259170 RepID=A0A366KYH0_9SPHI|nr:hypothetical protein DRW42_14455 [Pedobacter miscanthi]